ncbi:hypothetical protein BDV23DRAFT_186535 [Aspergillus alliaceus]|uniref:Zn(2)-C6 fungal-type domain-containing protein n=1 Tax=Petromyces alliaceus TaxID=209559 RepID=A0A5N7BZK2_PETAA|nr:hypothetical protein BDV23DRAFT_186535 [Aspergillus alliaceus]
MGNTGLPSKDCHTCRRRRVKCDLGRPGCLRCEKIGQDCPGYRDLGRVGSSFRIVTPESYPHRKRQNSRRRLKQNREQEARYLCQFVGARQPSLPYALTEQWEAHVKPLVISQFTIVTSQGARVYGSVDFLPQLLEHADTKSTLYTACSAIASAYFTNRARSDSIGFGHRKLYGKVLRSLSNDVANVEMQKQDSTLATMWLLCLYELIAGTPAQESKLEPQGWEVHSNAMIGLLRLRGQSQFQTSTGRLLFQLAYQSIQIQAMQTGRRPPPEAIAWLHSMQTSPTAKEMMFLPAFLYSDLASRIYSTIRDLIDQGSREKMLLGVNDIVMACKNLESSISAVITQDLASQSQPGPSDDLTTGRSAKWLMNKHAAKYLDACLFKVHQGILDLLSETLKANPTPKEHDELLCLRESSIKRLQDIADHILVSLPQLMPAKAASADKQGQNIPTWGHALKLLWPLRLISSSAVVHEEQRAAADLGLLRMGHEAGIMQALGA